MTFLADWRAQQTGIPRNEIRFFRFFANLLSTHLAGINYYEVHGNPGHVEFQSGIWPTKPLVRKELGDLIIITYSYHIGQARYTIQQNKFQKSSGAQRTWPSFKFRADVHQYDLLAFRPDVTAVGSIPFPSGILSDTEYDSVGSYGVFFEGPGHLVDFAYSAARWLSPQSYANSCNLILNSFQRQMMVGEKDVVCTVGIEEFLAHLLTMRIGAPIANVEIGGFLSGLIRRAAQSGDEDPPIIDLPVFNELPPTDVGGGGFRLLLINVDKNT
jgi:hypothetical protein